MLNILFLGDSPILPTGMGKITRSFIPAFSELSKKRKEKINITHIATGGGKEFNFIDNDEICWHVIKSNQYHGYDGHGYFMFEKLVRENKYDSIIFNHDIDVLHQFFYGDFERIGYDGSNGLEDNQRILLYTPVDTKKIYPGWLEPILKVDKILTYTNYGRDLLKKFCPIGADKVKTLQPKISENYLTVEEADKASLRAKYGIPEDKLVFYYNGRNDWRKAANILLNAYRRLKSEHKDIFLIIHSHDIIGMGENSIQNLLAIRDEDFKLFPGIMEDSELKELYLLSDIFVTSCLGEGFGYCPIEAVLSGIPTVTVDFPVHRDLYGPGFFAKGEDFVSKTDRVWTIPTVESFYGELKKAYLASKDGTLKDIALAQKKHIFDNIVNSEQHTAFLVYELEELLNVQ